MSTDPNSMRHDHWLWIATMVYAIHVMEEHALNWVGWANATGLGFSWADFYVTNAAVIVLGITCASVGWRAPVYSLSFPGLMLVNAVFFHIGVSIFQHRLNPGCVSAALLFVPVAALCYAGARKDGVLTLKVGVLSLLLGAAWQAAPLAFHALAKVASY